MEKFIHPIKKTSLNLIRTYHYWISPLFGNCCRFFPTCSQYAHEAIEAYGIVFGGWLTVKRLCRCHPWAKHGYDPVPRVK